MPRHQVQQSHVDMPLVIPPEFWTQAFQLADLRSPSSTRLLCSTFMKAVDGGPILNLSIDDDFTQTRPAAAAATTTGQEQEEEQEEDGYRKDLDSLVRLLVRRHGLRRMNVKVIDQYFNNSSRKVDALVEVAAVIGDHLVSKPEITKLSLCGSGFPEEALGRLLKGAAGIRSLHIGWTSATWMTADNLSTLAALQSLDVDLVQTLDFAASLPDLRAVTMHYLGLSVAASPLHAPLDFSGFSNHLTAMRFPNRQNIAIVGLGSLQSLLELSASWTHPSIVTEVAHLTRLTSLRLTLTGSAGETDLVVFSELVNLQRLVLDGDTLAEDLGFLTFLTSITALECCELPAQLPASSGSSLASLSLEAHDFLAGIGSMEQLCTLTGLRRLDLRGCKGLGSGHASALTSLSGLTALNLQRTLPRLSCVRQIRSHLTQLVVLDVSGNARCKIPACWTVGVWLDPTILPRFIDNYVVVK